MPATHSTENLSLVQSKHTLAELLPGPDPTPPPKTPTPTTGNSNCTPSAIPTTNCCMTLVNNPFEDLPCRPSPSLAKHGVPQSMMRSGMLQMVPLPLDPFGPHPGLSHRQPCRGMQLGGMMTGPGSQGKVYPPHQPMVFNPSNPNAPPIYPCGICHKEVHENDQAILCESGCNFWFHRGCTGLTEDAFRMLKSEVYAEWVCDRCINTKNVPLVKYKP